MSQSSKVQISGELPAGMLKFGIDQCITLSKAFFVGFLFFKTGYNVPCTFYKPMGFDLKKLYKKLTRINRVKNDITVCYTFPKVQ